MVEDINFLLSVRVFQNMFIGFREAKISQQIRGRGSGRQSLFSNWPKNTKLIEDVKFLIPVNVRKIPFSGCNGENVSANQRPGWSSFSDQPENTYLVETLSSCFWTSFA